MRHVKISKNELQNVAKLYESVMSNACNGLFFREGTAYGSEIAEIAEEFKDKYWETAKKELIARGWVEDIGFKKNEIVVKGSIEASEAKEPTCHRLRGILRHLFETQRGERLFISEKKCMSMGDKACVFVIEPIE
jgi:predicted hydrocarbon binding protein